MPAGPDYAVPPPSARPKLKKRQVQLIANGDLRLSANQKCWPEQERMEAALARAVADAGYDLVRAHPYKDADKHGFIASQKEGMAVVTPDSPRSTLSAAWSRRLPATAP